MRAVDLFAGLGGLTAGAEQAGAQVLWAANHWPLAVSAHQHNHPHVEHVCQDLRQADWTALPRFDLLLAAPACQGHSTASQPRRRRCHDRLRATAWAVVDCVDVTEPAAFVVENVPSFGRWKRFGLWCYVLEQMGYRLSSHILRASHFGVPQRRDRLFVVGLHRDASRTITILPRDLAEPAFGPSVDWQAGSWRPVSEASPGARARIARSQRRHGPRLLTQHTSDHMGTPLSEPIRTVTTQDHWAVVDGDRYRPLTVREYARAMGFSDTFELPQAGRRNTVRLLANAVCPPVARAVVKAVMEVA